VRTALHGAAAATLLFAVSATAHHSFAMFDQQKDLTLVGTVREFQWTNPHVWLQLDVVNASGESEEWGIEGSTPSILGRKGWTRHSFQPGDKVSVTLHPMKSGDKGGSFMKAVFADGRTLIEAPGVGGNSPQALVERP
jgi:hypothetical protein